VRRALVVDRAETAAGYRGTIAEIGTVINVDRYAGEQPGRDHLHPPLEKLPLNHAASASVTARAIRISAMRAMWRPVSRLRSNDQWPARSFSRSARMANWMQANTTSGAAMRSAS